MQKLNQKKWLYKEYSKVVKKAGHAPFVKP